MSAAVQPAPPATSTLRAEINAAVKAVRSHTGATPEIALVLGTGLGALARRIEDPTVIEYATIPGFPVATVESHAGRLLIGRASCRERVLDHV